MWRELICKLSRGDQPIGDPNLEPGFFLGATQDELAKAELLGSSATRQPYRTATRVHGVTVISGRRLMWNIDGIVRTNLAMRID